MAPRQAVGVRPRANSAPTASPAIEYTVERAPVSPTGLVPSEHSSGQSQHRGSITKVGNPHLRRVLVEASWSYRHRPALTKKFKQRSQGLPPDVVAYAWAAQLRLSSRYRKLAVAKGHNKAVVAVARELAGFVWGLMNDRTNVN